MRRFTGSKLFDLWEPHTGFEPLFVSFLYLFFFPPPVLAAPLCSSAARRAPPRSCPGCGLPPAASSAPRGRCWSVADRPVLGVLRSVRAPVRPRDLTGQGHGQVQTARRDVFSSVCLLLAACDVAVCKLISSFSQTTGGQCLKLNCKS